jgi:hypothetical protein
MSDQISEGPVWEALEKQWREEGGPGLLESRGSMFQVICPDGTPIFIQVAGESLYSSTSVSAVKSKPSTTPKSTPKPQVVKPESVVVEEPVVEEPVVEMEQDIEDSEDESGEPEV